MTMQELQEANACIFSCELMKIDGSAVWKTVNIRRLAIARSLRTAVNIVPVLLHFFTLLFAF